MSTFAIAGLQVEVSAKDNRYLIQTEIEKLLRAFPWVKMVVVGELATFGSDPANAQSFPCEAEQFYADLAKQAGIWLIPGSMHELEDGVIYNTAPVINPQGEIVSRYRKMFPFYPYEKAIAAGDEFVLFDVPDVGRFGLSICYDQWFPETTRTLVSMGAEVVLCPTMTNTVDRDLELCIARANAAMNQCYFFNINVCGALGNGRSIVVGPDGTVLHQAQSLSERFPIEVDLSLVRRVRERGVFGLGQTLKSFRDSTVEFSVYGENKSKYQGLKALGELKMPS